MTGPGLIILSGLMVAVLRRAGLEVKVLSLQTQFSTVEQRNLVFQVFDFGPAYCARQPDG